MNADPLEDEGFEDEDGTEGEESSASSSGDDPDTDNVGDPSVEINVEDLIRELEGEDITVGYGQGPNAKRRLEEIMEEKRALRELADFDDYDL